MKVEQTDKKDCNKKTKLLGRRHVQYVYLQLHNTLAATCFRNESSSVQIKPLKSPFFDDHIMNMISKSWYCGLCLNPNKTSTVFMYTTKHFLASKCQIHAPGSKAISDGIITIF